MGGNSRAYLAAENFQPVHSEEGEALTSVKGAYKHPADSSSPGVPFVHQYIEHVRTSHARFGAPQDDGHPFYLPPAILHACPDYLHSFFSHPPVGKRIERAKQYGTDIRYRYS